MSVKRVVVFRHGHSPSASESGVSRDEDRPLSAIGRECVRRGAEFLGERGIKVPVIVTSPLLRAVETAGTIASVTGASVRKEARLDGSHSQDAAWSAISPLLAVHDCVLAVGHQPVVGYLVGGLSGRGAVPFSPADFYILSFDSSVPKTIQRGFCSIELFSGDHL